GFGGSRVGGVRSSRGTGQRSGVSWGIRARGGAGVRGPGDHGRMRGRLSRARWPARGERASGWARSESVAQGGGRFGGFGRPGPARQRGGESRDPDVDGTTGGALASACRSSRTPAAVVTGPALGSEQVVSRETPGADVGIAAR